ncbi:MAG: hypothetical protein R3C18_00705 [Planctomycetaceae bacterium]
MAAPRRFSLQLTPLFDLMLIVIFAQYLAVRSGQIEADKLTEQLQSERDDAELHREQAEATQKVMAELLVELFRVPDEDIAKIVKFAELRSPSSDSRLQARFKELATMRREDAIRHILTYEEIRKRCDIWTIHIEGANVEENIVTLQVNDEPRQSLFDSRGLNSTPVDVLVAEMLLEAKRIPEQKSMVLILLTYSRTARFTDTSRVRGMLLRVTQQMEENTGRRTRYDFADMGFAPAS